MSAGGKITDPSVIKAFLDLVSRCDSLHDFDGKRHATVNYVKVENKYIIKLLKDHKELGDDAFNLLKTHLDTTIGPNSKHDLDNILKASCTALVSCKEIGNLPATVVQRLSKVARLTRFEPRTLCFYELYSPYFDLDKLTYGMGSLLTSEKIPCYDYQEKKYGYYTEDTEFEINESAEKDFQSGLCATLNLGLTESDGRAATGLYINTDGQSKEDFRNSKRTLLSNQLLKFFGCKKLKLLVDTTVISLGECGITDTSVDISQICTHASDWDGAEKSSCENVNIEVAALSTDDQYERCIFALNALVLGVHDTIVEKATNEIHTFKNGTLPVDVNKLSSAIEAVAKSPIQYRSTNNAIVTFTATEFLDFKRTGDALQVMSVKRLNDAIKKQQEASRSDGANQTEPMQRVEENGIVPMEYQTEPMQGVEENDNMESDDESASSAVSKMSSTTLAPYEGPQEAQQPFLPSSPNRLKINPPKGYSYGPKSPSSPTSEEGSMSYSTKRPANRKTLHFGEPHIDFHPEGNRSSTDNRPTTGTKRRYPYSGGHYGEGNLVHAFVTVDSLAFLKARLNGVPSIFTFTDFNTRERLMYLYKPEVANIKLYWENTYKDLATKCTECVQKYNEHINPDTNYVDFVDMVVGKAITKYFITEESSVAQWSGVLNELEGNMSTDEPAQLEQKAARVSFIQEFRKAILNKYNTITIDDLFTMFTQGFSTGAGDKLCPANKMMSMFKGLLDAKQTIEMLQEKFDGETKTKLHNSDKILYFARNLGTNVLKIVASTLLIEIYNKVCLYLTNLKTGVIPADYKAIVTSLHYNESTVQQDCVKMTCFLERYTELNKLLADPNIGTIIPLCGIDYAMYSTMFGNIASCIGPFLHKNPSNLNGASRDSANSKVGLRHLFVGSTNREQGRTYKLIATRVLNEMIRPICDMTKSVSKQIINSLYVPNIDETYRRMDIYNILMGHLKDFEGIRDLQVGGVNNANLPSAGTSFASPATSKGVSSISGNASTQNVSMGAPSQDPMVNSPPTPTSRGLPPPFESEFKDPKNMYAPDELYCAIMDSIIDKPAYDVLDDEDKETFYKIEGNKYVHKLRRIAYERWSQLAPIYLMPNTKDPYETWSKTDPDYLAELTDFAMFTNPKLLLCINTAIIADKYIEINTDIGDCTQVSKGLDEIYVNNYALKIQDLLEQQLFVHDRINEGVTRVTENVKDTILKIITDVLGPELINMEEEAMEEDAEKKAEIKAIIEYYNLVYNTDYKLPKDDEVHSGPPATGGHKVRWSLEDYHRKYYPPYAQLYYDTV